jgi:hypothetical protein
MRVYVSAPARVYTGGPTALFQLCHTLKNVFGIDSYIAFYNIRPDEDPVHANYRHFKCPWVSIDNVYDEEDNIVIVPETATHLLSRFRRSKKVIYWLAVDNYILRTLNKGLKMYEFIWFMLKNYPQNLPSIIINVKKARYGPYLSSFMSYYVDKLIKRRLVRLPVADLHIAQSHYAKNFLESMRVNHEDIILIREPVEDEFLDAASKVDLNNKKNIIAWNSRKAYPLTLKLIKLLERRFKVFNLGNVGKNNMIKILTSSKIFIDIGFHPGRDRPVREAVVLGNIAVINNHGGYYLREDCPVPEEFKIKCPQDYSCKIDIEEIYENIISWITNYDYYIKMFKEMRDYILSEPKLYVKDVEILVTKLNQL